MGITLYGVPASRAARSLWMLEELCIEYRHVPTHFQREAQEPEFLAINPNGRVPALDDDGTLLFESLAINLYLAEKYGKQPLWPESVENHGRCYQWSLWAVAELERPGMEVVFHRFSFPEENRDEAKARAAEEVLRRPLRVLDGVLAGRDYLLDAGFSVADLNVAAVLFILATAGRVDLSPYPNAAAWLGRCAGRPARSSAWAETAESTGSSRPAPSARLRRT